MHGGRLDRLAAASVGTAHKQYGVLFMYWCIDCLMSAHAQSAPQPLARRQGLRNAGTFARSHRRLPLEPL